ncbi:hypothetical protein [Streptomyces sp. NPDC097619]|uniref:hypothetical protein n=1 Tax=Streptomyces sp. NPDC097619 TaxID=3157228 RepID=UPI0033165CAE
MKRPIVAVVATATVLTCGAVSYAALSGPADALTVHSLCAADTSRDEYVATNNEQLAVVTVTGREAYLEEEPELPGGVQLYRVHVDRVLKGGTAADLVLGQSSEAAPASTAPEPEPVPAPAPDPAQATLVPDRQYVVGFHLGGSYGDGYVMFSRTVAPAEDREELAGHWRRAVAARQEQPDCEDTTGTG